MATLKSYRDLVVWQESIELVVAIYELTRSMPPDERFGLTQQMRRAAVSIPSNIAEGYARGHRREYLQFLSIAIGSLAELETQLIVAVKVGYITRETSLPLWERSQSVGKMLRRLKQRLTK